MGWSCRDLSAPPTAVLHGSQPTGGRGGRAAERGRGRWIPAKGCLAQTGQESRVLLQDGPVLPLYVSTSASYVPAETLVPGPTTTYYNNNLL